jgi:hypothetical protein
VTALSRNGTANPFVTNVTWSPYGPLQQYDQQNTLGGIALRTRITRNLAYRPTGVYMEAQSGSGVAYSVVLAEDDKGRITKRDYTSSATGVQDSYFLYDDQDRVLCETTSLVSTCPTSGSSIKNSHTASPPFTDAGDWKVLKRPIPGSTGGLTHTFNPSGYGTSHQVTSVVQSDGSPALGTTTYGYTYFRTGGDRDYDALGDGSSYKFRGYAYDNRHNVTQVGGFRRDGANWRVYYDNSAFDAQGRRVWKSMTSTVGGVVVHSSRLFYYDPLDRLTEIRYTPSTASSSTYTVFQLLWLGGRLTGYWQTDYPSATTSKRYVATDETGRPMEMWSWPSSGNATQVWAINPSAWGFDTNLVGPNVFQPVLFAGQYQDTETVALLSDGATVHRPGLVLDSERTYDAFTGSYLQVDNSNLVSKGQRRLRREVRLSPFTFQRKSEVASAAAATALPAFPSVHGRFISRVYSVAFRFDYVACDPNYVHGEERENVVVVASSSDAPNTTSFAGGDSNFPNRSSFDDAPYVAHRARPGECFNTSVYLPLKAQCYQGCGDLIMDCSVVSEGIWEGYSFDEIELFSGKPGVHFPAYWIVEFTDCLCTDSGLAGCASGNDGSVITRMLP